jgi:hypothetical protein
MTEPEINKDSDFQDILNKLYELYDDTSFAAKEDLTGEAKKLIDCPHEIIFKVTANVLEENKEGQLVSSKEICTKDYHIPVPADKDYKEYMNIFFDFLENGLASSADKIYNQEPANEKAKAKRSKRKSK